MQHSDERLASACFWSFCSLGLCLAHHSSTLLSTYTASRGTLLHRAIPLLQQGFNHCVWERSLTFVSCLLTKTSRDKERDTHITEHFSKSQRCCTLKTNRKHARMSVKRQKKKTDDMDARPVTDSNSLAPYETLCTVSGVFLICNRLCLYSNCSREGTYDSGPGGSER